MVDQSTPASPALLPRPVEASARATRAKGHFPLVAMAMAAALPICFFGGLVAYVLADSGRESAWLEAQATAAQVAEKVSAELSSQQQVLQTLASSTALDRKDQPDLSAFYVEAARVKLAHPLWETVELVNLDGNQVMNLFRPIGQPLGRTADRESLQEVIRTGRPVVGGIGPVGSVSGRRLIAIRVPVDRSSEIRYVVSTLLEPSAVISLLRYAGAPKDWVGAVVDARGVVIASTSKD
ncbi:cache domain-containing protein, partial [Alsobacter soli]